MDISLNDYPKLPSGDALAVLREEVVDWGQANGLGMRLRAEPNSSDLTGITPHTLLPSPFPRKLYNHAVRIQNEICRLYMRMAHDVEFLEEVHKDVVQTDEFTRRLLDILKAVKREGLKQKFCLAIQRSDYMAHKCSQTGTIALKMVEVNNIASGSGSQGELVSEQHRRTLRLLGHKSEFIDSACPFNKPNTTIANAIHAAWKHYNSTSAYILFIVEETNQNQTDQRHIQWELEKQGIPPEQIIRRTLTQCAKSRRLDEDRQFWIEDREIAVVYFRAGYVPEHYPTDAEWTTRLDMERSFAVKCPWIGLQVANTKKVQQVLSQPGCLERFVTSSEHAWDIRNTFAGLWPVDRRQPEAAEAIDKAIKNPTKYVLKAQLEGGHGNTYGEEISEKLQELTKKGDLSYVLMEKLTPFVVKNYPVKTHEPLCAMEMVGELGIYGYIYGDVNDEMVSYTGGHVLRSKGKDVDMGGIAVGAAVIDSPFLYDDVIADVKN